MLERLRTELASAALRIYSRIAGLHPRVRRSNRPYRANPPSGLPLPPEHLLMAVAGTPEIRFFLHGGELAATSIRKTIEASGARMEEFDRVLDFGCGCGRVLRWWNDLEGPEIHGTDYNEKLTAWCREHLDFARIGTNRLRPPLSYEDGTFDLVYALSVMTHLDAEGQREWMAEFRRILRPGGRLLFTTHGASYLEKLGAGEAGEFLRGRLVVRHGGAMGTNTCNAFHPAQYVRSRLAEGFEVVDHRPEGALGNPHQDLWLLRTRATDGA